MPLIAVIKQPNANLIAVNDSIEKKVEQLSGISPNTIKLVPYYKQANFVNTSIKSIEDVLWIGIAFAAICVAIIVIIPSKLPSGFLPKMDEGSIVLDSNSPPGTTLEETGRMLTIVNTILHNQPEVAAFSSRLGTQMGFFITEPNRGDYLIKLKDSRSKTTKQVSYEIRTKIEAKLPQLTVDFGQVITDMLGDLTSSVQPIQIKVFGDDKSKLHELSKKIASEVDKVKGTADVFDGILIAGPEIHLKPKEAVLAQFGLSPADFQLQLQTQISGTVVSTTIDNMRTIDIRMLYPDTYKTSVQNLRNTSILLPNGSSAPISQLAEVVMKKGVAEIDRENEKTVGFITARLNNRDLGSTYNDIKSKLKNVSLPANFHIEYEGLYQQQQAFHELLIILIAALLLVFAVILFLFRNIKVAAAIVFIAIFGVAGYFLGLFLTGTELNVGSYMGIIMIVGIIWENSIFTYRQYQEGEDKLSHEKKVENAIAARIRPLLMTIFAAIVALTPPPSTWHWGWSPDEPTIGHRRDRGYGIRFAIVACVLKIQKR